MKKIVVLTATRAEYGLLKPLISKLNVCDDIELKIVATGAHLSENYGYTYKEIEQDGFSISKKINILSDDNTETGITKTMGNAMYAFADYFADDRPDALIVLGDRYETMAVCLAAMNCRIPILHIAGGETTEGAIDEAIRHAISKLSYLHFTSNEIYRKRVIQLGESPERVFVTGSLGVENALHENLLSVQELSENLKFDLTTGFSIVTFHPVTLEDNQVKDEFEQLLMALDSFDMKYIITKANADAGGKIINDMIDEYAKKRKNVYAIDSLGMKRYLSAVRAAKMVIGNSSSGISEAPTFHTPTVNIGDRQKGRLQAKSVINCGANKEEICRAMQKAMSEEFLQLVKDVHNPYGDGDASEKILKIIREKVVNGNINLKKTFYNIEFEVE